MNAKHWNLHDIQSKRIQVTIFDKTGSAKVERKKIVETIIPAHGHFLKENMSKKKLVFNILSTTS